MARKTNPFRQVYTGGGIRFKNAIGLASLFCGVRVRAPHVRRVGSK